MHLGMNSFSGLPITAGGITISSYLLMGENLFHAYGMALLFLVIGLLMVGDMTYMESKEQKTTNATYSDICCNHCFILCKY